MIFKVEESNKMLKQYAMYFASYLLNNLYDIHNIERIVLFGSVARGEADKESDVDIFIEVKRKTKKIEEEINKVKDKFYESREASLFKLRGIDNEISVKIGKIKEWEDLQKSIASTGIILYGPYESKELPSKIKKYAIIFWNKIRKNRGAFLNKLYGVKVKGKYYEGLVSRFSGKRIGKSCIIVPIAYKKDVFNLLKKYKVEAKVIEVFGDRTLF